MHISFWEMGGWRNDKVNRNTPEAQVGDWQVLQVFARTERCEERAAAQGPLLRAQPGHTRLQRQPWAPSFLPDFYPSNNSVLPWVIFGGLIDIKGFPGSSDGKESACNAGYPGLIPRSGRCPGEGNSLPTLVFLPRKSHGWRNLVGYSSLGHERVRHDWVTKHIGFKEYMRCHLTNLHICGASPIFILR